MTDKSYLHEDYPETVTRKHRKIGNINAVPVYLFPMKRITIYITYILLVSFFCSGPLSRDILICISPGHHVETETAADCHCEPMPETRADSHHADDCIDLPMLNLLATPSIVKDSHHADTLVAHVAVTKMMSPGMCGHEKYAPATPQPPLILLQPASILQSIILLI